MCSCGRGFHSYSEIFLFVPSGDCQIMRSEGKQLCEKKNKLIFESTHLKPEYSSLPKVFKKEKELKKGIAFPTCISVNNCVCHFSPTKNDPDCVLKVGDVVKMYGFLSDFQRNTNLHFLCSFQ